MCFLGFIVNLDLEGVSVVRYAKIDKPVPKSESQRPSGRRGPERPDGPVESGKSGESGTDIITDRTAERIYNRPAEAQDDNFFFVVL